MERRDHAGLHAARAEVAALSGVVDVLRLDRPAESRCQRAQALGQRLVDRLEHAPAAVTVERGARGAVGLRGEEDELDGAHPERRRGPGQQGLELGDDLGRAGQRASGLVQELELRVAAPLREVGAIRGHQQNGGRHQQQAALGASRHHGGDRERETGVAEGDGPVREQHVEALLRLQPALRDRHGGADADVRHERRGRHSGEHGKPHHRVERIAHGREPLDDEQGHAGAERELSQVEEGLEDRDLTIERERDRRTHQAGEHQLVRGKEHQATHERHLAERQRVGAAPEVQVHDPALGSRKSGRHGPPGHIKRGRPAAERRHEGDVSHHGEHRHDAAEDPDLGFQTQLSSEGDHSLAVEIRRAPEADPAEADPGGVHLAARREPAIAAEARAGPGGVQR